MSYLKSKKLTQTGCSNLAMTPLLKVYLDLMTKDEILQIELILRDLINCQSTR